MIEIIIAMARTFVSTIVESCAMCNAHCSSGTHACMRPAWRAPYTACHTMIANRLLLMMMHSNQHHLIRGVTTCVWAPD